MLVVYITCYPSLMYSIVPFCLHGEGYKFGPVSHNASLADVAPTVLRIMGLDIPREMTGQSLVIPK